MQRRACTCMALPRIAARGSSSHAARATLPRCALRTRMVPAHAPAPRERSAALGGRRLGGGAPRAPQPPREVLICKLRARELRAYIHSVNLSKRALNVSLNLSVNAP